MVAKIKAYKATEDIETSYRYIDEHRKVLEAYGVKQVTSASHDWLNDENTYVIIVESEDGEKIYGGGRIQVRNEKMKMPMEGAIAKKDERIYGYVDNLGEKKLAEFCGLFNSKEVAGYGIGSIFLGRIGVAITSQVGVDHLLALCSPPTLRQCLRIGFEIIRDLGNNGTFYYPKEGLIATAIIVNDLYNLPHAHEEERERIMNLREHPVQYAVEKGPKGEIALHYNLDMKI
ncbi:hypothetical protein [Dyadobacter fanqingshengii]|uniref:Uncharacterized protein n=1 Tax=Dyadobacter fanqingshengii TaxID=2906443 RepID=A0A9X1PAD6_9BACT|nr:hypothetical protein [Dyadobacter fanqingshengii]MCF0040288.1 hypothetical protein [Dyadobacter fanqingshengii]MCF2502225.1 hypothetical protein [Dyadobacter fanqingshengii]USJ37964.1 hypothetical protein NFI81_09295 [Dyadobacter fanqingshengii]